jgi:tetratricopeptide (TPR) repeat protein
MSFFKKLLGSDPDTHLRKAEELFARGAFGEAKLAFERARDALPGDRRSERDGVVARIDACRDGIAKNRIAQGLLLRERGERELAKEELRGALEVAADPALVDRAQAELDDVDRVEVQQANRRVVMTREERIAVLAGSWYEEQATEYAGYGDEFFDALLALDDEDFPVARDGFAAVLAKAEEPVYLILEHAKACTLAGDSEAAVAGYRRFLAALPEGEGGDRRLGAHIQIGSLHGLAGDQEGALDAFQAAVEDFPDDYRPYFALGQQLRISGAPSEALEVLELALDRAGASPEWSLLEEIGLTLAETGNGPGATAQLESVLKRFVDRGGRLHPAAHGVASGGALRGARAPRPGGRRVAHAGRAWPPDRAGSRPRRSGPPAGRHRARRRGQEDAQARGGALGGRQPAAGRARGQAGRALAPRSPALNHAPVRASKARATF